MKLSIVDEEKPLCETLGDIFQDKGFSVAFALYARDAIDLMNVEQFDVGYVDIKRPDGDGLVVLHTFKERFPDRETPSFLYRAKEIVEKYGGTIWMDSNGRNKDSVFTFSNPYCSIAK